MEWSEHPLGEPSQWPAELKTAVRTCLTSKFATMVHWGSDHHTFYNDVYAARLGRKHPGHLGQPAQDWWSEMWDQLEPFFEKVLAGDSYYTENACYTPDRDGVMKDAYFTHSHSPIWDDTGIVRGIFLTVVETTAQLKAEARSELLMGELKHRMKNTLSVVQAIVNQSVRRAVSKDDVAAIIRTQIAALARAHDLLTQANHDDAPLSALIRSVLDMEGYENRISVEGPEVIINSSAIVALTLILHELNTNAMKYGALSNERGGIRIFWDLSGDILTLIWQENDGPAVTPPARQGYGTRLILALADELGEVPQIEYLPTGFRFALRAHLEKLGVKTALHTLTEKPASTNFPGSLTQ
ncbi:sensor histidine kinase [Paracoccus marcusii]|uniref:sensor histidine kinase n=1 Tax=Paracoccus marcusii TaxID=59779 RepID=UPI00373653FA